MSFAYIVLRSLCEGRFNELVDRSLHLLIRQWARFPAVAGRLIRYY